jgi:mono/diheme cytochrome c family protein
MVVMQIRCTQPEGPKQMTKEQMVARGKYLVTIASCNDCHSPKVFTAMGPIVDTTKLLSGHPANSPLPPIDTNALHPGYWYTGGPDLTSWVGPWGISYTANITADSSTGIGAWSEDVFIASLRTGKHLGLSGGRDILPPMPWNFIGQMTDEDLKSVFAYLHSIPAISNQVPPPVAPPDVKAMLTSPTP